MTSARAAALASVLALSACATTDSSSKMTVPVPMSAIPAGTASRNPGPSGEVTWTDLPGAAPSRRARFDDWTVTGPTVNLMRRPDGMWAGTLFGSPVTLSPTMGNVSGSGVDLTVEWHGTGTWVTGICLGAPVRFEISGVRVAGTVGGNAFELPALGPGRFGDGKALVTLSGAAARTDAPMPQVALALLATLLR